MNLDALLCAIAIVESSGNPLAVGDSGEALGLYQLRPIYVQDVNRILGVTIYQHADALHPGHAANMVRIYLSHYATPDRLGRPVTDQDRARIHNGGPNGWRKDCTTNYWTKVKGNL